MSWQSEVEFINRFDCCFPYEDRAAAITLIDESLAYSPCATFAIVYELMVPGQSSTSSRDCRLSLLAELDTRFTHLLKQDVLNIAIRRIRNEGNSATDVIQLMDRIAEYHNEYGALNVAYSASSIDVTDADLEAIEAAYERIIRQWKGATS